MNRRPILVSVVTALVMFGILTWLFERFFHYPPLRQTNEEPAAAEG